MSKSMAYGVLIGMAGFGVKLVKIEELPNLTIHITIPEFSDHVDVHGNEMAGKLLIKRLNSKMTGMLPEGSKIVGTIRKGETWAYSNKVKAETEMLSSIKNYRGDL